MIVSLTRSNVDGDIGFMVSPERLNVLLSRARNALIIIGDSSTFVRSRKGAPLWKPLIELLADSNYIYDGLPVRCEQHPRTEMVLKTPEDFDEQCPEGGCSAQWYVLPQCRRHSHPKSPTAPWRRFVAELITITAGLSLLVDCMRASVSAINYRTTPRSNVTSSSATSARRSTSSPGSASLYGLPHVALAI